MNYIHLGSWPDHKPRPVFDASSYQYSYDGKTHAFEAVDGVDEFLNFVAGIIEETGFDGIQGMDHSVDAFLISAGVTTKFFRNGE
tara:strand:- start:63 stop:317 length:255 start_codon:yes stop_codon:yes gene_type:complete